MPSRRLNSRIQLFVALLAGVFVHATLATAQVYVSPNGDNTTGTSWATALFSIHDAVTQADLSMDDVWVAEGHYLIGSQVDVPSDMTILGGFPASGNPGLVERDPALHESLLDGQDATGNIFSIDAESNIVVDGFKMIGAIGAGSGFAHGGAVNCINGAANVSIQNCVFERNLFINQGAGINIYVSTAAVSNCEFRYNIADEGGGIKVHQSTVTIVDSRFTNNIANDKGGGISAYDSDMTVERCVFSKNFAENGAGLESHEGTVAAIINSLFERNMAKIAGGGLHFQSQAGVAISNCTIASNRAPSGGGCFFQSSGGVVTNSIFHSNTHHAIYENNPSSDPTVENNLFFQNRDGAYFDESTTSYLTAASLNAAVGEAQNNLDGDPLFVNADAGAFHLRPGSPCIDTGTGTGAPSDDFDGEARPVDVVGAGQESTGTEFDIGYDEFIDSDGDSMPDWWENANGLNDAADDSGGDADLDGLLNADEYLAQTDPQTSDTDGDGVDDATEVAQNSNPNGRALKTPVYVSQSGNNTTGDSWTNALNSLAAAVALAAAQDSDVWVAAGSYNIGAPVSLADGVALYGGFPASGNPAFTDRDSQTHVTTLDGQNTSAILVADSIVDFHVDGFVIQGGQAARGAALYANNECFNFSITDCVIQNNSTTSIGGGVCVEDSYCASITRCTFDTNAAGADGGGLRFHQGQGSVSECTFVGNSATVKGGGISGFESMYSLDRCHFEDNAAVQGGAIDAHDGFDATVTNCVMYNNQASDHGAGLNFVFQNGVYIAYCSVVDNTAATRGGGALFHSSLGTITNSIFVNNNNHAIYENDTSADPIVNNNVFFDNPNGVYFNENAVTIATAEGPTGINTVLAEATNNQDSDPVLLPMPGSPALLAFASPCIDAGTVDGATGFDINGDQRPIDVPSTGADGTGTEFDIGADEFFDSDGDQLSDAHEVGLYGTLPGNPDTDGDTISDGDEVAMGTNPLSDDSDGDGILDQDEIALGTDPTNPDTDGDKLPDGWEQLHGFDPLDDGSIDPNNGGKGDPDNDGFSNFLEFLAGTDPNDGGSKPVPLDPWMLLLLVGVFGAVSAAAIQRGKRTTK